MTEVPLPPGWTSGVTGAGQIYFISHTTKETTWEHPWAVREPTSSMQGQAYATAPRPVQSTEAPPPPTLTGRTTPTTCSTPRVAFWLIALFSLAILGIAIAVTTGNEWIREVKQIRVGGHRDVDVLCSLGYLSDDWCLAFDNFSIMQIMAMVCCSIATVVLLIGLLVPRADIMGYVGGVFFLLYAVFQLAALALVVELKDSYLDSRASSSAADLPGYGGTFQMAAAAFCLGLIEGLFLIVLANRAEAGLVYNCCCAFCNTADGAPAMPHTEPRHMTQVRVAQVQAPARHYYAA